MNTKLSLPFLRHRPKWVKLSRIWKLRLRLSVIIDGTEKIIIIYRIGAIKWKPTECQCTHVKNILKYFFKCIASLHWIIITVITEPFLVVRNVAVWYYAIYITMIDVLFTTIYSILCSPENRQNKFSKQFNRATFNSFRKIDRISYWFLLTNQQMSCEVTNDLKGLLFFQQSISS